MTEENLTLKRDGLTLAAKFAKPSTKLFDLAIMAYGFNGAMEGVNELLKQTAAALNQKGIATLRFDFNGHGDSDGSFQTMSIFNELEDFHAVLRYAKNIAGVRNIYLVGHSQGGFLSSLMAGMYHDQIGKLVLLAPALTLVDDARRGICQGVNYDANHVPEVVNLADGPLNGWYFRSAQCLDVGDFAPKFGGPTLIIHGTADKIVNPYVSIHYEAIMQQPTLKLSEGNDHGLTKKRDKLISTVVDFLTE